MRAMSPMKNEFRVKGVEFLGVNVFDDLETMERFVSSSDLDMTWLWGGPEAVEAYGVSSVPALLLIDENGTVIWKSGLRTVVTGASDLRTALERSTR
jgi:hypothetical protein